MPKTDCTICHAPNAHVFPPRVRPQVIALCEPCITAYGIDIDEDGTDEAEAACLKALFNDKKDVEMDGLWVGGKKEIAPDGSYVLDENGYPVVTAWHLLDDDRTLGRKLPPHVAISDWDDDDLPENGTYATRAKLSLRHPR